MKYIDNKTGEFRNVPIADYLNRAKANAGKTNNRKTKIVYTTLSGTAAQARLEIDGGTYIFHDYMNLLKINGEWKIVGKVFWHEEKSQGSKKKPREPPRGYQPNPSTQSRPDEPGCGTLPILKPPI